jgi:hypothetical protein
VVGDSKSLRSDADSLAFQLLASDHSLFGHASESGIVLTEFGVAINVSRANGQSGAVYSWALVAALRLSRYALQRLTGCVRAEDRRIQ